MPKVVQILDPSHPDVGHWALIVREGSPNLFGIVLNGLPHLDTEGVAIDATSVGDPYVAGNHLVDVPRGTFKRFPVHVYGKPTSAAPDGQYMIAHPTAPAVYSGSSGSKVRPLRSSVGAPPSPRPSMNNPDPWVDLPPISGDGGTAVLTRPAVQAPPVVVPRKVVPAPKKLPLPSLDGLPASSAVAPGGAVISVDEMAYYLESSRVEQAVMFWGPPGVGKSAGVQQYADRRNATLKTVLLSMTDPTMLKGIGVADMVARKMVWLPDESIPTEPNSILFLDEITSAPQLIQALAYQITWDRAIGDRPLPPDCRVILAGNRTNDRGVAFGMPSPLANRCVHLTVQADIIAWRKWAFSVGIDPRIVSFLSWRADSRNGANNLLHHMDPAQSGGPWPSPRSWENANHYLKSALSPKRMGIAIAGCVGVDATRDFVKFCVDMEKHAPRINDILSGSKQAQIRETDPGIAITLATAVVANTVEDPDVIRNVIRWSKLQDGEFRAVVTRGLEDRFGPEMLQELTAIPSASDSLPL